jgi:microcystin-dependent protein
MSRICFVLVLLGALLAPVRAMASSEPFLGELMVTGYNFCPNGWASASGQLMAIAPNTALFSLLGTQFGGNGVTTFALPDLRGRVPMGQGQGNGLSDRAIGEQGGTETVTLTTAEMPMHTHAANASTLAGNTANPAAALPARKLRTMLYRGGSAADTTLAPDAIASAGGSQPHNNMPPYLAMTWCIATQGIYPQRP